MSYHILRPTGCCSHLLENYQPYQTPEILGSIRALSELVAQHNQYQIYSHHQGETITLQFLF